MIHKFFLTIILLLISELSFAQTITREDGEEVEVFVNRLMPDGMVLAHHVIETNRWSYPQKMVVACYGYNDTTEGPKGLAKFNRIEGHVYLPTKRNTYRDIIFGPIEENDGYPEIVSIFFINADRDTTKEMAVLCKYPTKNYDFDGVIYRTFIYDNPTKADTLACLTDLSRSFYGMEGTWRDGKINRAKYKTAKEIKAKLRKMGY